MNIKRITVDDLPTATAQEVFDHVANHLLTQMVRSQDDESENKKCLYRGPNGTACAAGSLFDFDNPAHARVTVHCNDVSWDSIVAEGFAPSNHIELIGYLQDVHDCNEPAEWRNKLEALAWAYGFEWKFG